MVTSIVHRLFKKRRKYPIKRDIYGRSARERCFESFDQGLEPAQVALMTGVSIDTARRYYRQWKNLPRNFAQKHQLVRAILKSRPELADSIIRDICDLLGLPESLLKAKLQQPWGTRSLMLEKFEMEKEQDVKKKLNMKEWARLKAVVEFLFLYEVLRVPPETIKDALDKVAAQTDQHKGESSTDKTQIRTSDQTLRSDKSSSDF